MRRNLVLTNEAARHPFRQRLPRPVLGPMPRKPLGNMGLFMLTFVSGFLGFSAFLG